jgi:hypothetical protein
VWGYWCGRGIRSGRRRARFFHGIRGCGLKRLGINQGYLNRGVHRRQLGRWPQQAEGQRAEEQNVPEQGNAKSCAVGTIHGLLALIFGGDEGDAG